MAMQLAIEKGNSYPIAAKGIFAISLTIFFYTNSIVNSITDDLNVILFISGIFISILSLTKPMKWLLEIFITRRYDSHLKDGSFGFWKTINEPQWQLYRNNIIGDIYLIVALLLISIKISISPKFIDLSELESFKFPFIDSSQITQIYLILLISGLLLIVAVGVRIRNRLTRNENSLILSQYFLSVKNSLRDVKSPLEDYYLNKQWFHFCTHYRIQFQAIQRTLESKGTQFTQKSSDLNDTLNIYSRLFREIYNTIKGERLYYHSSLEIGELHSELDEFELKIRILQIFYNLIRGKVSNSELLLTRQAIKPEKNEWDLTNHGPHAEEHIRNANETLPPRVKSELAMEFHGEIDYRWVDSFYSDFDSYLNRFNSLIKSIEKTIKKLSEK